MCRACADDPVLALECRERLPEYLRQLYLFEGLDEDEIQRILAGARTVRLESGRWLYHQGEAADRFFVVRSGQIALFRQSADGRESIVALVGEDEVFGEETLILEAPRHDLNARAVGEAHLLSLERAPFRSFLEDSSLLCLRLASTFHRRQQMLLDHIEKLTLHDATQRVMAYLLEKAGGGSGLQRIKLAVPKATLASHLSIQPETLSRILARLKECHYLTEEPDAVVVVRTDELRAGLPSAECSICHLRSWGCPGPERHAPPGTRSESPLVTFH